MHNVSISVEPRFQVVHICLNLWADASYTGRVLLRKYELFPYFTIYIWSEFYNMIPTWVSQPWYSYSYTGSL